ncbi:amino acid ABC transporter substrate-binding protein [Bosea sp. (in: a-proteobacteria)]|uniref:amino acid ABC transporter substrate-binding protein n=1 Tax=Bosea sp. (in: a-proteobacteria) TaxID=1871050 RepID=UPI002FCA4536
MTSTFKVAALALAATLPALAVSAGTLEDTKARGSVNCGVSPGVPGFSLPDAQGKWNGLDVDICRAVAAALFNDASKVSFTPLNPKDRFAALSSKQIDILARQTTWTLSRETTVALDFGAVNYYDGQGLLVRKALNVKSAKELGGASVCVQTGSTSELNLADFFRANNIKYEPVAFNAGDEAVKAFEAGRCDVFSTDASALFAYRLKLADPAAFVVLPEIISKEPLGPATRKGDEQWSDLVKWSHFAMVNAEELGLSSGNVDEQLKTGNPEIKRFLGVDGNLGEGLGLGKDWAYRIVKLVGNYGESYEANLGANSRLAIPRGLNNLWTKGGLQYAPPVR